MFNLLSKNSIGLDIADHTIEVAELEKRGESIKIVSLGRIKLAPGIVELGRIKDEKKLLEAVKKVFIEADPKPITDREIIFGLPESQVYTNVFVLRSENNDEREQLIFEEIKKIVPLSEDDLTYSYKVIGHENTSERILLVATSKEVVLEWQDFFKKAALDIKTFDIETLAVFRSLFVKSPEQPTCVIDIGSRTTNITIFDKKGIHYSYSILKAGNYFTESIVKTLKITAEEAEKEKLKADLTKNDQVTDILIKSLEPILEEIKPSLNYFTRHRFSENKKQTENKDKKGEVILIGGSSQIKGLTDYLSANLGVKVRLGGSGPKLVFLEAIGLALRGLDNKWNKKDPAIEIIREAKDKTVKKFDKEKGSIPYTENNKNDLSLDYQADALKLKKQKIILSLVLIIGSVLIGASFLYRNWQESQKEISPDTAFQEYQFPKSIKLQIPIVVEPTEYTEDRIRGRIISNENEKKPEESLIKTGSNEWLAYSVSDAQMLFVSEITKNVNVDFILDNIEYQGVELSDNPTVYFLKGKVNILTKQVFESKEEEETSLIPENTEPEVSAEEKEEQLLIKDTPTGWLNVREGPGTVYSIITKVNPGEKYIIREKKDDWIKIELSENEEGWVYDNYVINTE